jgi:hypothetical protein
MASIPKFKLTKAVIKTEDELQKKLAESGGFKSKYLDPGKHDVTIQAAVFQGPARDPNWGNFKLTLEGLGEKTTTAFLLVPMADVEYTNPDTGKKTTFLYGKFQKFMKALGVVVTIETLEDVLNENFTAAEDGVVKALIGRTMTIQLGFDGNYIKYIGKDEIGTKVYNIVMADGSTLADTRGKALVFADFDAASAHAEANQIRVQKYASVLEYTASANAKIKAVSNW